VNDCIGEMRDQEMATEKWENEGGRIAVEQSAVHLEARLKGPIRSRQTLSSVSDGARNQQDRFEFPCSPAKHNTLISPYPQLSCQIGPIQDGKPPNMAENRADSKHG
jgi:hypothetical protein